MGFPCQVPVTHTGGNTKDDTNGHYSHDKSLLHALKNSNKKSIFSPRVNQLKASVDFLCPGALKAHSFPFSYAHRKEPAQDFNPL